MLPLSYWKLTFNEISWVLSFRKQHLLVGAKSGLLLTVGYKSLTRGISWYPAGFMEIPEKCVAAFSCFGELCGVFLYPTGGIRMCVMFGAILQNPVILVGVHPLCSLLMLKGFLTRPVLGFVLLAIFPCWATSSMYLNSSTRNALIHWGFVFEELICHKTWNKARGNFFIRFLLHKMCWCIEGKVAFYDK